jgi:hypothetical protein
VHLGDHVLAVHHQRGVPGHPQRHVQHRPVLRHVDVLAAEHRVPALGHPGLGGQLHQQPHGLAGDPVLGVVEIQPGRLRGQPLAAPGVGLEQLTQRAAGDLAVVALERLPGLAFPQRRPGHQSLLRSAGVVCHRLSHHLAVPEVATG